MGIEARGGLYDLAVRLGRGEAWLSSHQEVQLRRWVEANLATLLAYWDGDILYDQDLRARLVAIGGTR